MRTLFVILALLVASASLLLSAAPVWAQQALSRDEISRVYDQVRIPDWDGERLTHATLVEALAPAVDGGTAEEIRPGRSAEKRLIRAYYLEGGPIWVVLWSQAHGDAEVGTKALSDVIHLLASQSNHPISALLREKLTFVVAPMLNPDGAQHGQRRNAQGVDILSDGRRRVTPEGQVLQRLTEPYSAAYVIGLEGPENDPGDGGAVEIRVPTPASGASVDSIRLGSMRVAGTLATGLVPHAPAGVLRREGPFDPRSFPDRILSAGSRVVVVGLPKTGPQDEEELRRGMFIALVSALHALATGEIAEAPVEHFANLPPAPQPSAPTADLLIPGASVKLSGLPRLHADVALAFQDPVERKGVRLLDIGDLALTAEDTLTGGRLYVSFEPPAVEQDSAQGLWMVPGGPTDVEVVRRTRTYRTTLYTTDDGALRRSPSYQFPQPARWSFSLHLPFLLQELGGNVDQVEIALHEVGWNEVSAGLDVTSARVPRAIQAAIGRSLIHGFGVGLLVGRTDEWRTTGYRIGDGPVELAQKATFGALLLSYEYRYFRFAAGPAWLSGRWRWSGQPALGTAEDSGGAPGLAWEANLALPAGTWLAPELRLQHQAFRSHEISGFQDIPPFRVRHGGFSIGMGATLRWWGAR